MGLNKFVLLFVFMFFLLPSVSAFYPGSSPLDILSDEWTQFIIVLAVLFVAINSFLKNKFENKPVSLVISLGLSLLISTAIIKKGFLSSFFSESLLNFFIIIAIIAGVFFIVYRFGTVKDAAGNKKFNWLRLTFLLGILGMTPYFFDFENILPEYLLFGPVGAFIEFIQGIGSIGFYITIILIILWFISKPGKWIWKKGRLNNNS